MGDAIGDEAQAWLGNSLDLVAVLPLAQRWTSTKGQEATFTVLVVWQDAFELHYAMRYLPDVSAQDDGGLTQACAEDDAGNQYIVRAGGAESDRARTYFSPILEPALDPDARHLTLINAATQEPLITLELPVWPH